MFGGHCRLVMQNAVLSCKTRSLSCKTRLSYASMESKPKVFHSFKPIGWMGLSSFPGDRNGVQGRISPGLTRPKLVQTRVWAPEKTPCPSLDGLLETRSPQAAQETSRRPPRRPRQTPRRCLKNWKFFEKKVGLARCAQLSRRHPGRLAAARVAARPTTRPRG